VRSKRKGTPSIASACHQCHFAARQLEQDTHRQELLAAGERAWQEMPAPESPTPHRRRFTEQHTASVQRSTNQRTQRHDTTKRSARERPPSCQRLCCSLTPSRCTDSPQPAPALRSRRALRRFSSTPVRWNQQTAEESLSYTHRFIFLCGSCGLKSTAQ